MRRTITVKGLESMSHMETCPDEGWPTEMGLSKLDTIHCISVQKVTVETLSLIVVALHSGDSEEIEDLSE